MDRSKRQKSRSDPDAGEDRQRRTDSKHSRTSARGHAVEARILVNVDERSGGYLNRRHLPFEGPGIKVITNFGRDYFVPGGYDGHIAKILVTEMMQKRQTVDFWMP